MKDIKGYEGLYAVTPEGKVWSYRSNRFLKPQKQSKGYYFVVLYNEGRKKTSLIHRLVAEAYIPNPEGKETVNHKREFEKWNNSIENLEWATTSENNNYGTRTQRTQKQVYCVELNKIFNSITEAANELGLTTGNITSVCKGRNKTTGGYHWEYVGKND